MERNEGTDGLARDAQIDANEFSGSGSTPQGADGPTNQASQFDYAGTGSSDQAPGIRDRAKSAFGTAGDKLADVGSGAREKVGAAKDKLANALESGAERLRERTHGAGSGAALAGATANGTTADGTTAVGDGRVAQVSDRVAGGMEATADWLRQADIDGLKAGIETQVKEHPGRTLLIALGLGYLVGRAFKNNQ
ncbi:MAG: hypothetical protein WD825_13195 [Gemmatimonadaceae bacterium]